jgi:HEXXH motif-containing protein
MITWKGRALTGPAGAEILTDLAKTADFQSLQRSEEANQTKFSHFEPWMSNAAKRAEWSDLQRSRSLVPPPEDLKKLKKMLNDGGPLRAISPVNVSQDVADSDGDLYQSFCSQALWLSDTIKKVSVDHDARLNAMLVEVIPLGTSSSKYASRADGEGLSSQTYRGAVFLKLADESAYSNCEDLLNFIHELGHQAFNLILNADPIVSGDAEQQVYSVIRKTMRPGVMSFHALAAVAYMLELMVRAPQLFCIDSEPTWATARFDGLINDMETGLATIKPLALTSWGKTILLEFEELAKFARQRKPTFGT